MGKKGTDQVNIFHSSGAVHSNLTRIIITSAFCAVHNMKTSTLVIIFIVVLISALTWLVSIWQYDAMMSSMMTFYNPAALSLFVVIWTAGMAAMMFPAIVTYDSCLQSTYRY